jgi:benzoate/toluate 1,2-dioxygenase alpha subunit
MPRIPVINTSHLDRIDELLVDNEETGEYKLHRSVFTDQALFDLEMKYIFEGNWVYLAHESQIPKIMIFTPPILVVSQSLLRVTVTVN